MTRSSSTSTSAKELHPLVTISRQIFSPYGRTNRAKFWLAFLIAWGIIIAAFCIVYFDEFSSTPLLLIAGALWLLGIVIYVLAGIRRLHDRDMSGHWLWLFYLAPKLISRLVALLESDARSSGETAIAIIWILIAHGLFIWGIVEMGVRRGTSGPNRYGPDPLQHKQDLKDAERARFRAAARTGETKEGD